MNIEFDSVKDVLNRGKHGVSLAFGERIWGDKDGLILPTVRFEDEEERFKAIGSVSGRLWTAIHVYRGSVVRLISVRRSNENEQNAYRDSRRP